MADKNTFIDSAQRYLQKGLLDKAIKEYYRALEIDPRDVRVRHKLGELLARQGTRGEALKELGLVAESYSKDGFYLKAVAVYKQLIKIKPDLYDVHLKLGSLYQQLSLLSDAMEHYRIVAEYYELNGTSKDCLEVFKKIVELSPDDLHSRLKLAEFHAREEQNDEAVKIYRNVAVELKERNRTDDLIRVLERLTQLEPSDLEILKQLARLYLDGGEPRRALTKLQICFKADPGDTETLSLLGETFGLLDQVAKARSVFKELARIYEYQGFPEKRLEVMERVHRLDPDDVDARAALGIEAEPVIEPVMEPVSSRGTGPNGVASSGAIPVAPATGATPSIVMAPPVGPGASIPVAPPPTPIVSIPVAAPAGREATGAGAPASIPFSAPGIASAGPASPSVQERQGGSTSRDWVAPQPARPAAAAAPLVAAPADRLREIPQSIARLMTEIEVYLKYSLLEKATNNFRTVFEREPDCYAAREKYRDFLVSQGRNQEAAAESERMSRIASGAGDNLQARLDLEQAAALDPGNLMYKHALASLSRFVERPAAPPVVAPPPFFGATSAQVLIEVEDEEEEEVHELVGEDHVQPFHLSMDALDEHELVDDGEGVPSVYLTLNEAEFDGEVDEDAEDDLMDFAKAMLEAEGVVTAGRAKETPAPPVPLKEAPAIAMEPVGTKAPAKEAPAPAKSAPVVEAPAKRAPAAAAVNPLLEEEELVDDHENGLDLMFEIEAALGLEADSPLAEPVEKATRTLELAQAYFQMGLYEDAANELERAKGQGTLGVDEQWLLAKCRFQRGEYGEAVRCFQTLLNRNDLSVQQEVEILFDLGLTYEAQREYHLALELFEEISSIDDSFREEEVQARLAELGARTAAGRDSKLQSAR